MKRIIYILSFLLSNSVFAAQDLSGPRMGFTVLSPKTLDYASSEGLDIQPFITQFGWQFERRFFSTPNGPEGVFAFVPLLGGAEQGVLIPSLSWLTGLRTASGMEFAAGPNVTLSGVGIAFAAGKTYRMGELNLPLNLSVVGSDSGFRVSFLFGFNGVD